MCEATVFLAKDGVEHEIMQEVEVIEVKGNRLSMADLLGRRKTVRAKVVRVDFDRHKVLLEEAPGRKSPGWHRKGTNPQATGGPGEATRS